MTFHDEDAKPLYPPSTKFLTGEWFIASGRLALHKSFIEKISIKKFGRKGRYDYYCIFKCKNQKQYRLFTGSSEAKKSKLGLHRTTVYKSAYQKSADLHTTDFMLYFNAPIGR